MSIEDPRDTRQPWASKDTGPVDRAFFYDLVERLERQADDREKRLREALRYLPIRWWFTWLALTALAWALIYLIRVT